MEKTEFDARFKELAPIIYYGLLYDNVELTSGFIEAYIPFLDTVRRIKDVMEV